MTRGYPSENTEAEMKIQPLIEDIKKISSLADSDEKADQIFEKAIQLLFKYGNDKEMLAALKEWHG